MKRKVTGWVLIGLGAVALGYLGYICYLVSTMFYPWYTFVTIFRDYPVQLNTWGDFGIPLMAGVLLLIFGIRRVRREAR